MEIPDDDELVMRLFLPYISSASDSRRHLKDKIATSLIKLYNHYEHPAPRSLSNASGDVSGSSLYNALYTIREKALVGAEEPYLDISGYTPVNMGMLIHLLNSPDLSIGLRSLGKAVYDRAINGELSPGDKDLRETAMRYFEVMKRENFRKALHGGRRIIAAIKDHDNLDSENCQAHDQLQLVCPRPHHFRHSHMTHFTTHVRDIAPINFGTPLEHLKPVKFHYGAKQP
ncbi:hypothetical protein E1189_21590 [Sansalvadorimonas verongulae]|nr:hypothetical protein [Sansalvadorimonas verongulae]